MSEASKLLSMCLLVSSARFKKLDAAKQTEVITSAGGKPIIFVENFTELKNRNTIVQRLLAGEDVAMQLEFNGIELTKEEQAQFSAINPLIKKINEKLSNGYQHSKCRSEDKERFENLLFKKSTIYDRETGNEMTTTQFKKVWKLASRQWFTGETAPRSHLQINYSTRYITITEDRLSIGCQSFSKALVEMVAEKLALDPEIN